MEAARFLEDLVWSMRRHLLQFKHHFQKPFSCKPTSGNPNPVSLQDYTEFSGVNLASLVVTGTAASFSKVTVTAAKATVYLGLSVSLSSGFRPCYRARLMRVRFDD